MATPNQSNLMAMKNRNPCRGWTSFLDALSQGVMLTDVCGRTVEVNPAAEQILGMDRESLLSCCLPGLWSNLSAADGSALSPGDFPGLMTLRTGSPAPRKVLRWSREDGSILWLEVSAEPIRGGGALIILDDVTEYKLQARAKDHIKELYFALGQVNQAIVRCSTAQAMMDKICEVMVECGKFAMAWIGWEDPETHEVRIASKYADKHGYLDGPVVRTDDTPLGQGGTGRAIREGRTNVLNDFLGARTASPWHEVAIRSGFAASAAIPIRRGGRVWGALNVHACEKDYFGSEEIVLLEETAISVSFGLSHLDCESQRRQAEEGMKQSRGQLRTLIDTLPDLFWVKDTQGVYLTCNSRFEQFFGAKEQEIIGKTDYDFVNESLANLFREKDQVAMAAGAPITIEEQITFAGDGHQEFLETIKTPTIGGDGKISGVLGIGRNITERKKAEESLRVSEEKFHSIFDLSPDSMDITHLESGEFLELNLNTEKILGYSRGELMGRSTLPGDLGIWVNRKDREKHVEELKAFGISRGFETPRRRKDGTIFIAQVSSALTQINGEMYNISITRDITERKRAEDALRESNQRLELAITSGSLGVWDWNLVDDTETWNDRMYEIYGLAPQAPPQSHTFWRQHVHPEDLQATDTAIRAAIGGDVPYDFEFRVLRSNKEIRYIKSYGRVLRDAEGKAFRVIGINRDLTREVEAEAERQKLEAQLLRAQKMESLGRLAGGIAHDMNNVLTAILGMASINLETQPAGTPTYQAFNIISQAAVRGGEMVKGLLTFARQNPVEKHQLNLNAIILEGIQLLKRTTLSRVRLEVDLAPDLRPIEGDASALGNAFMNLYVNSVDAMPNNGTLTLRTRNLDKDWIGFLVMDTGFGMSKDVLAKAMDPFFTTKEVGKGTGLGLAMVYSTVKAHQGRMDIQSEPGKGTCIRLRFPACECIPQPAVPADVVPAESTHGGLSLLLVDDDELIQESIGRILEAMGHRVTASMSGEDALAKLAAHFRPDVVILDMNMPGLGGAGTLPRLRRLYPTLPVLLATGRVDQAALNIVARYPHVTMLSKPFGMKELQQKLEILERA